MQDAAHQAMDPISESESGATNKKPTVEGTVGLMR